VRFVVVGAGRLGGSLAIALRSRGSFLLGFTARSPEGRVVAESWLGMPSSPALEDLVAKQPDLILVTVPDRALPEVAAELAPLLASWPTFKDSGKPPHSPVVIHTSGATSVDVLAKCREAGASTLVFHPLQTFSDPLAGAGRFEGAAIAITPADGNADSPAGRYGFALARTLGARPFLLSDDKRSLYHAAATVACNYLVTLEHHARRLFVAAGLPDHQALGLFLPLVEATLANVAAQGTVAALTGPLSRGDAGTVAGHLEALTLEAPDLLPLYRALGLATLDIVKLRGELPPELMEALAATLAEPTRTPPPPPA
jgi:predicted short-subunit dehydrogenase-like oxidoreductase (DUF2520 family)